MTRKIEGTQQNYIEEQYELTLWETKLSCHLYEFKLKDIFDVSFRKNTNKNSGTLYLHTNQGVFPYQLCSDPHSFITRLKRKIKN